MANGRKRLTEEQILRWARAHRTRIGRWPDVFSGSVQDALDQDWSAIDGCLEFGGFGLPGGSSLAELLARGRPVVRRGPTERLTVGKILEWADAHHARIGRWPNERSGAMHGVPGMTWGRINGSLYHGRRGLPKGGSLAKLLAKHRDRRNRLAMPRLTVKKILQWADAHHRRTGTWPSRTSGSVHGQRHETWKAVADVLAVGGRGLRYRTTLAELLAKHRNVAFGRTRTRLSVARILAWADAHRRRTGEWPTLRSGPVLDAPGEVWGTIDNALRRGGRGLAGGSSVTDLLRDHRHVPRRGRRPRLTESQILRWADAHHERTGRWPTAASGPVRGVGGENWSALAQALHLGLRGLPGDSSLHQLLFRHRRIERVWVHPRRYYRQEPLTIKQILIWADEHRSRTGAWPTVKSGPIPGSRHESWARVQRALSEGKRGLPGGSSITQVLRQYKKISRPAFRPRLTIKQILRWADEHHARTGKWPIAGAGEAIPNSDGETWLSVQGALNKGCRGLPGGTTLAQLLAKHRGVSNPKQPTPLTIPQILKWADAHKKRTGSWPHQTSGPVRGVTDPRDWLSVERALVTGCRNLAGGTTLAKLLAKHRGVRNTGDLPALTIPQILQWADAHHRRTGGWPRIESGPIPDVPGETWHKVNTALHRGLRGMRGGTSLAMLLEEHRAVRHKMYPPRMTVNQVLAWVDAHHEVHGRWPTADSGPIDDAPGETWGAVDRALTLGVRGLNGHSSLARFLDRHRR